MLKALGSSLLNSGAEALWVLEIAIRALKLTHRLFASLSRYLSFSAAIKSALSALERREVLSDKDLTVLLQEPDPVDFLRLDIAIGYCFLRLLLRGCRYHESRLNRTCPFETEQKLVKVARLFGFLRCTKLLIV